MRIGLYDPYLNTLGGGERYFLTIAAYLSRLGHQVDLFWEKDEQLKSEATRKLNLDLAKVNFIPNIFSPSTSLFQRWQQTRFYDVIFYLSDGSLPFLFSRQNILHFQVPFRKVGGRSFLNQIKLAGFKKVICNSGFTKKYIDQEFGIESVVVYPPVSVGDFRSTGQKKNIILTVGRFTQTLHAKKQDFLIKSFRQLVNRGLRDWRLVLIGGTQPKDRHYLRKLQRLAAGQPIEILTDVSFADLKKYYAWAKIYWHAAGFGEEETRHPERMEHFGITVVEAMAAGSVPVVINKGGIPEIVTDGKDGFLWQTEEELKNLTLQLIKSPEKLEKISLQSIKSSKKFSKQVFCQKINEIIA